MTVGELCSRDVVFADADLPVLAAARRMRDHHVGDLVVIEEDDGRRRPVGIVTDRDLVVEVLAENLALARGLRVGDVMSADLVMAREADVVSDVLARMRARGVRRVPVVDEHGDLAGIITYDDLVEWLAEQLEDLGSVVRRELRTEEEHV
jgi:CBS domain-containing protein